MTLAALIRKRETARPANANPAKAANDPVAESVPLARLATLALASPTEPKPATVGAGDTAAPFDQEWFEERAAIYEFDAGYPRHEAERLAYLEVVHHGKRYFH